MLIGHQDESEKEVIARQQVSRALFELLEGYLKERKCKPTESRRAGDEAVGRSKISSTSLARTAWVASSQALLQWIAVQ